MTYPDKFIVLKDTPDYPAGTELTNLSPEVLEVYERPVYGVSGNANYSLDYLAARPDWFHPIPEGRFWPFPPVRDDDDIYNIEADEHGFSVNKWHYTEHPRRLEEAQKYGLSLPSREDAEELIERLKETIRAFHREQYFAEDAR